MGIDLGGSKIEILALGPQGEDLFRRRCPTPRDYAATLDAIADLVTAAEEATGGGGRSTLGIGHCGAIAPATGLMQNANATFLDGRPFDRDLMQRLRRPIAFANDANCLGLSEAMDGAAAGARVVFAVVLGTGVGGAVVADGRIHVGPNAIGGEWGHNPLPRPGDDERPGLPCYCGRRGCIETWLAGPALALDHERATGRRLSAPEIVAAADAGDDAAEATMARYEERLARALGTAVNLLDPDVVVIGGGLSNVARLYPAMARLLPAHVFTRDLATPIRPARHGDSSGVRGAAWLGRTAAAAG
ncbi:MAG: ROK family protein [Geminicoccaceae bacterium]|nr:ROK family protein [Geminicoccaceae bacterium]